MPLFSRPRSPAEIVRNLKEALNTLERGGDAKKQEKVKSSVKNSDFITTLIVNYRRKSASSLVMESNDEDIGKRKSFIQV